MRVNVRESELLASTAFMAAIGGAVNTLWFRDYLTSALALFVVATVVVISLATAA